MPKLNDGNEQDLRVRPALDAPSLEGDNPFTGDNCTHGSQQDIGPEVKLPSVDGPAGYDWSDSSKVCPRGFDNRSLNQLMMSLLKNHFSRPECIFYDSVKPFIYSADPLLSRIRIVMNTTFDPAKVGQVPSLVVFRGAQQMVRIGIGDYTQVTEDFGETGYSRMVSGQHSVLALGGADGFTEELAFEVFDFLNAVSPILRQDLPLHDFQVDSISEVGALSEVGSLLGVRITVKYVYEYSWSVRQQAPTISRSRVALDSSLDSSEV